jgi:acyl-CoA synthetase (AMP-forming)/AMP-acid ligase II
MSYARLERSLNNVGRRALAAGLERGDIVALFITDPIVHAVAMLVLTRMGIITLSGRNPRLPPELDIEAVITDNPFPYQANRVLQADASWLAGSDDPLDEKHVPRVDPDEICRIVLTSGTTGDAKAVALSHRMVAARIARHQYCFGSRVPYCSRTYCDLGYATSLGFQVVLAMLWRGGMAMLPGGDGPATLRAFGSYNIENIVTSPGGLSQLLRLIEANPDFEPRLETVFSGGSVLPPVLSERVRARLCSNVITAYGSTEASMVATVPAHAVANVPGAAGYVLPGITVEIVNANGQVQLPGKEGVVRIRSDFGVNGYLGDPAETARTFHDGWFYPGDTGYLTPGDLLVISGRSTTILNVGGDKLRPELVEEVLGTHPSVEQSAVLSLPSRLGVEELWAVVVSRGSFDESALRAYCLIRLPSSFVPVRFLTVGALPLSPMGKVERRKLPDLVRITLSQLAGGQARPPAGAV